MAAARVLVVVAASLAGPMEGRRQKYMKFKPFGVDPGEILEAFAPAATLVQEATEGEQQQDAAVECDPSSGEPCEATVVEADMEQPPVDSDAPMVLDAEVDEEEVAAAPAVEAVAETDVESAAEEVAAPASEAAVEVAETDVESAAEEAAAPAAEAAVEQQEAPQLQEEGDDTPVDQV